jgi:hypothetical protein
MPRNWGAGAATSNCTRPGCDWTSSSTAGTTGSGGSGSDCRDDGRHEDETGRESRQGRLHATSSFGNGWGARQRLAAGTSPSGEGGCRTGHEIQDQGSSANCSSGAPCACADNA